MTSDEQLYNLASIHQSLTEPFDDSSLDTLCLDHFPDVCDKFGRGMRTQTRHCSRQGCC